MPFFMSRTRHLGNWGRICFRRHTGKEQNQFNCSKAAVTRAGPKFDKSCYFSKPFPIMDSPKSDLSVSSDDSNDARSHSDNDYDLEVEDELDGAVAAVSLEDGGDFDSDEGPYRDEPLADEEFMDNYNREIRAIAERNQRLVRRFQGTEELRTW